MTSKHLLQLFLHIATNRLQACYQIIAILYETLSGNRCFEVTHFMYGLDQLSLICGRLAFCSKKNIDRSRHQLLLFPHFPYTNYHKNIVSIKKALSGKGRYKQCHYIRGSLQFVLRISDDSLQPSTVTQCSESGIAVKASHIPQDLVQPENANNDAPQEGEAGYSGPSTLPCLQPGDTSHFETDQRFQNHPDLAPDSAAMCRKDGTWPKYWNIDDNMLEVEFDCSLRPRRVVF